MSILIIVGFQFLAKPVQRVQPCVPTCPETVATNVSVPGVKSEPINDIPKVLLPESVKVVDNDLYAIEFSDVGGAIKHISLKKFNETTAPTPFCLANISDQSDYIGKLTFSGLGENSNKEKFLAENSDGGIMYRLKSGSAEITKKYSLLKDKYGIGLNVQVKNTGAEPINFDYRITAGAGVDEANKQDKRLVEISAKVNGKTVGFKQPRDAKISNMGEVEWTALKNKYFSLILKPFAKTISQFYSISRDGYLVNGVDAGLVTVLPGETMEHKYLIYAGPSDIEKLKQVGYGLDETVNYGVFAPISKFIIVVMKFFYSIVHSWGISILLLSIFLNVLTFPLTMKSFKSMQKMQELHPQMEKLKVQYKGNPQKLNQEMMALYKTYKINPLSGCLPMLLQMPIFFALYQALMKSIELRCTKFLWIKDLSMPDAVPIPFTLPLIGNSINILPLVMVAAMVVQQKMSTKTMGAAVTPEQREQQKMMLIVMPIMFGFIFYNMPSGLVLYWVTNTVLTIVEQSAVLKKD